MSYHTIPIGEDSPKIVNMIVEIPQGSSNKYEYDHELDVFKLDRTLYSPLFYPFDYGWICDTLADDGDPLDILVMTTQPTFPGCLIAARPLGVLMMRDDKGADEKILSVAAADPRFSDIAKLSDLPSHILKEIVHFFDIYKELEEKQTIVLGWQDVDTAHSVIEKFRLTPAGEQMARARSRLREEHSCAPFRAKQVAWKKLKLADSLTGDELRRLAEKFGLKQEYF